MRHSGNVEVNGIVKSGFDYDLQVWVEDFKIVLAGDTERTKRLKGQDIREVLRKR